MANVEVIIGECRFDYVNVFEPKEDENGVRRYEVTVIIPKDNTTISAFLDAQAKAYDLGVQTGVFGNSAPRTIADLLHDGDVEKSGNPVYKGCYYVRAKSKWNPSVIGETGEDITSADEFYSGCYGYAALALYPYNVKGHKGVACAITSIMRTKTGDTLVKKKTAREIFAGFIARDDLPF